MKTFFQKTFSLIVSRPDIFFFYLFLATLTLTIRKVIFFYPLQNSFNEYTGVYIYLSDIFLFLTFFCCTIHILYYNFYNLSIYDNPQAKLKTTSKLFHVEQFKNFSSQVIHNYSLFFPLALGLFSIFSILWATNGMIASYTSLKLWEYILLFFYVVAQFREYSKPILNCSTWNIKLIFQILIASGIINSLIGIFQLLRQNSVGLFLLKESHISADLPGVAKIVINGDVFIRPYGLFPHPNIFAGYLVFCIFLTLLYKKSFITSHRNCSTWNKNKVIYLLKCFTWNKKISSRTINCSTWNKIKNKIFIFLNYSHSNCSTWNNFPKNVFGDKKNTIFFSNLKNISRNISFLEKFKLIVPRGTIIDLISLFLHLSLFLTASKSAIFGLFMGYLFLYYSNHINFVPRGTLNQNRLLERLCSTWNKIMSELDTIFFQKNLFCSTWNKIRSKCNLLSSQNYTECSTWNMRNIFWIIITTTAISAFFMLISDLGSNVLGIKSLRERNFYLNVSRGTIFENPLFGAGSGQFIFEISKINGIQSWQLQPVHNVYLLITCEYGLFILFLFVWFLFGILNKNLKNCSTWNNSPGVDNDNKLTKFNNRVLVSATNHLSAILIAFIFIMLFDHYLWDMQQGSLIFWLMLASLTGLETICFKQAISK